MSRVINFLLKDIASLTQFNQDISSRLCFLLGARDAIGKMLSVKEAAENLFTCLNIPPKEKVKGMDSISKKVTKEFEKLGYEYEIREDIGNVIAIKIRDRRKEHEKLNPESSEDLANKYVLEQIKHKGLPQVVLRRSASINTSMGNNVVSGDITVIPPLAPGDQCILMDKNYDIVGYGVADMSSEEIKRSPGRIAIRTLEGRYDVPKYKENKRYINGLFSVTTLPRLLGAKILIWDDKPAVILVIAQDDGEISAELLNLAPEGSKVHLISRNENHKKAIQATFERLQIPEENFLIINEPIDRYSKSRPREKYTHFYIEMPSTETGLRPNPFFELEEKNIRNNARSQFTALRGIPLIGENGSQISYVTHSIDPTENEEVVVQAFRQSNFSPGIIDDELLSRYYLPIKALPEIPTVTQAGTIDLEKMKQEVDFEKSWLGIDPIREGSDAGFVSKLILDLGRRH